MLTHLSTLALVAAVAATFVIGVVSIPEGRGGALNPPAARAWIVSDGANPPADRTLEEGDPAPPPAVLEAVFAAPDPEPPAPPPRPAPAYAPGFGAVVAAFGPELSAILWRVGDCESGYKLSAGGDPVALNAAAVGSQGELSLWQIHPIHFSPMGLDPGRLRSDIVYAAGVAAGLGSGGGWSRHWRACGR